MNVVVALALIALGMGVDAFYQRRIRIAECNAYDTGYQQGKKEERIREEERALKEDFVMVQGYDPQNPSMAAPVEMSPTFEERMRKHGRAVVRLK